MDREAVLSAIQLPAKLRLALDTLEGEMPVQWEKNGVRESLCTLRDKIDELGLREIRRLGPQEYLIIKPLTPDAGGALAAKTAELVKALDDLGLVVRLV